MDTHQSLTEEGLEFLKEHGSLPVTSGIDAARSHLSPEAFQ